MIPIFCSYFMHLHFPILTRRDAGPENPASAD